jgi:hypothetical protein
MRSWGGLGGMTGASGGGAAHPPSRRAIRAMPPAWKLGFRWKVFITFQYSKVEPGQDSLLSIQRATPGILSYLNTQSCQFIHPLINSCVMTIDLLTLFHVFSLILGLGGATFSDLLLFHFLKDLKVNEKEAQIMEFMGKVVFIGLGLIVISGALLFFSDKATYLASAKFQAKMVIFGVIFLNGLTLHIYMMPRLLHVDFSKDPQSKASLRIRRRAFLFGAVSVVSWYSAFFLGFVQDTVLPAYVILLGYTGLVLLAIMGSLTVESFLEKMAGKPTGDRA